MYPLVAGAIEIALPDGTLKRVGITRAHLEEDAGERNFEWQFIVIILLDGQRGLKNPMRTHLQASLRTAERTSCQAPATRWLTTTEPVSLRQCMSLHGICNACGE